MQRMGRLLLLLTLVGIAVGAIVFWSPRKARSPVAEALLRSPATQVSTPGQGRLFTPIGLAPIVIVPPATWYSFSIGYSFQAVAGDVVSGRINWMQRALNRPTPRQSYAHSRRDGYPIARGAGLIFSITPAAEVEGFDELSRVQIWSFKAAQPVQRLIWLDQRALVAASKRQLYSIDPGSGQMLWSADLHGTIETAPVSKGGRIFIGVDGDKPPGGKGHEPLLVVLSASDGRQLLHSSLAHLPVGIGTLTGTTAYCITQDFGFPCADALYAINADTGRVDWESDEFARVHDILLPRPQGPAIGEGVVCVALESTVYGLDASSGKRRWTWSSPTSTDRPPDVGWPLLHDGIVYFTVQDGAVALDAQTGRELWNYQAKVSRREVRDPAPAAPPTISGNTIVLPYRSLLADVVRLPSTLHSTGDRPTAKPINVALAMASGIVLVGIFVTSLFLRRLRSTVSVVCLLCLAATLWGWACSYSCKHFVGLKRFANSGRYASESSTGLDWAGGAVTLGKRQIIWETTIPRSTQGDASHLLWWTRLPAVVLPNGACLEEPSGDLGLRRFTWTKRSRTSGTPLGLQSETSLTVPLWLAGALFSVAPFAWLSGFWRDRRRYPKGHCVNCGYDLRASSDRCPECGHQEIRKGMKREGETESRTSRE